MRALSRFTKLVGAFEPGLGPGDIDREVARHLLERARMMGKASHAFHGLRVLDGLRNTLPDLLPGPATETTMNEGLLPDRLVSELTAHAQAAGYSGHGVRARLFAVRALYRLAPEPALFEGHLEEIPWPEIVEPVLAKHPEEMSVYRTELLRLAKQVRQRWSDGWKSLQARIVEAGVPRANNPVKVLIEAATKDDLEPWQLDREWAWVHERSLRAHLRHKWSRAIDSFDALHQLPGLSESGLLPSERLGPMPRIGARLKNAHLPLPRQLEKELEGESKQLHEAAHFVWRCLRAFGVYSRGDDPAPDAVVADHNLNQVMREQRFMTASSARLHINRIRDWRGGSYV